MMEKRKPIGIFDSGVGGLSICHAIKCTLPEEDLVYFADIAFSPYGNKSKNMVRERSDYIVNFLISRDCKAIVVACNTATTNSIHYLRSKFSIPIIGVEPAIKPAALESKKGVIGVLATEQTLESDSFKVLKSKYSKKVKIESMACPKFVSLVENLNHNSKEAFEVADQYVRPLLLNGSDKIILGCTHFSFLWSALSKAVGDEADLIDTASPVATQVKKRLHDLNLQNSRIGSGNAEFWTSGSSKEVIKPMSKLWGSCIDVYEVRAKQNYKI